MTVSKISTEPHAQGEIEVFRLANAAGAYVDVCNIGAGITAVVVPDREGRMADVALGSKSYGVASAFGEEPATLLVIYQEPGSNAVDVGNRVKAAIGRLSERFPDGVSCTTIVDSTESIRSGVKEIILTLILALVLVIAIIYLFIQDWRATLIPLVAIPVSLIGTFIFFPLLGFSINIISLLGLGLAM